MKKKLLPFFWRFLRPSSPYLLGLLFCSLTWAVINSFSPYILKIIIDKAVAGEPSEVFSLVAWPLALFISLEILIDLSFRIKEVLLIKVVPKTKARMREEMFDYVQKHSYRFFQENLAGTLSNKVFDMVRGFENLFISFDHVFFPVVMMFMITTAILWSVHPFFGLFVLLWYVIYFIVTLFFAKTCIRYSHEQSEANSQISGKIVDTFKNMLTVRIFASRLFENRYLQRFQNREVSCSEKLGYYMLRIHIFQGIASTILFSSMLLLFLYAWSYSWVTVGDFTYVMGSAFNIMIFTWWMAEQFVVFFKEYGVSKQALSVLDIPHEIEDKQGASPLVVSSGKIEFQKVTFRYQDNPPLFSDKTLTISSGEKVGLVGFSGSGKSTFVNLILRHFDLKRGKILIDDQDISDVTQDSLREQIAFIPQDTMLFHRSLLENIRYGRKEATERDVIEAAKKAECHSFIEELPEGYQAVVGEGGVKLSGGQRQRIAIARAILKASPILILDEATSALDSVTEKKIQETLSNLMEGKTTIVIAHRLSTLYHMDRILVFSKGKIVESGTHQELLEQRGHYAHLWQMQTDGFLPN